jgi:hypothetical protein
VWSTVHCAREYRPKPTAQPVVSVPLMTATPATDDEGADMDSLPGFARQHAKKSISKPPFSLK